VRVRRQADLAPARHPRHSIWASEPHAVSGALSPLMRIRPSTDPSQAKCRWSWLLPCWWRQDHKRGSEELGYNDGKRRHSSLIHLIPSALSGSPKTLVFREFSLHATYCLAQLGEKVGMACSFADNKFPWRMTHGDLWFIARVRGGWRRGQAPRRKGFSSMSLKGAFTSVATIFDGTKTITGGTGRFENATGEANFVDVFSADFTHAHQTFEGTIQY
jgi:hypothetical protein